MPLLSRFSDRLKRRSLWRPTACTTTSIVGTPLGLNAPFAVTKCAFQNPNGSGATYNVFNRTKHQLLTADVALRFFDRENTLIGNNIIELPVASAPVDADDAAVYSQLYYGTALSEPGSAVMRIECRPYSATFSGNHRWNHGSTWPEKLFRLPSNSVSSAQANDEATLDSKTSVPSTHAQTPQVTIAFDERLERRRE